MIVVSKRDLEHALNELSRIAGNKPDGITGGTVLLQTTTDALILTVKRDLQVRMRVPAQVQLGMDGRHQVIPAVLTHALVRNCAGTLVELCMEPSRLRITSGASGVTVNSRDGEPDDFTLVSVDGGSTLALPGADLRHGISTVLYASSRENFQAVFRGILMTGTASGTRFVASDGYRVAVTDLPTPPKTPFTGLLHGNHARDLLRLIPEDADATWQVNGTHVALRALNVTAVAPLMDGVFPDYERVIPKDTHGTVTVSTVLLVEAVNRVAVMADKNANNRLELLVSDDRMRLTSEGDYGRGQDTLDVTTTGTPPASLAVNARFLLEALSTMKGDVTLALSGSTTPFTLTSTAATGVKGVLVTLRV